MVGFEFHDESSRIPGNMKISEEVVGLVDDPSEPATDHDENEQTGNSDGVENSGIWKQ